MTTDNFIAGNYENKYNSQNLISKLLVRQFLKSYRECLIQIQKNHRIKNICEIGVAEGYLLKIAADIFPDAKISACDLSPHQVSQAKKFLRGYNIQFSVQDAEKLTKYKNSQFDLVICCEVLEHLHHPHRGLEEIKRITKQTAIISVPNEPLWRILNIIRGKYWSSFGNTPGHLNHWSMKSFPEFIRSKSLDTIKSYSPLPWQLKIIKINKGFPRINS